MDSASGFLGRLLKFLGRVLAGVAVPAAVTAALVFFPGNLFRDASFVIAFPAVFLVAFYLGWAAAAASMIVWTAAILKFSFFQSIQAGGPQGVRDALLLAVFVILSFAVIYLIAALRRTLEERTMEAQHHADTSAGFARTLTLRQSDIDQLQELLGALEFSVWQANVTPEQGASGFKFTFISDGASRLSGYSVEELSDPALASRLIYPEDRKRVLQAYNAAIRDGNGFRIDYRIVRRDGRVIWVEDSVQIIAGDASNGVRVRATTADITERRRFEKGLEVRAQTNELLESALDSELALETMLPFIAPDLADDCVIFLYAPDGRLRIARSAHSEPRRKLLVEELQDVYRSTERGDSALAALLRGGRGVLLREVNSDLLYRAGRTDPERRLLESLEVHSAMFVPLRCRDRTLGAMVWTSSQPLGARCYDSADLKLAEDLGRRIALALENARLFQAAQQDVQARDRFLAVLGHELRNPLNAISNAVKLSELKTAEEDRARYRAIVSRQARHMSKLIDDLLDVARVTSGRITLQKGPVDLRRLAADCVEACRPESDAHYHQVSLSIADNPVVVDGDSLRLEQLLTNLLNNAIKYTPPNGKIDVSVFSESDSAVVMVSDTGPGIPPEMRARIFEPFTMLADGDSRASGLGVGLALVKQLAELHGGSVEVSSRFEDGGSVFRVRLPEASPVALPIAASQEQGADAPRVLVVEDDADNRDTIREFLKAEGYEVVTASDGPAGVQMAKLTHPDIAIVDIGLPGFDGYEVARRLRSEGGPNPPLLVALTGFGQPDDRRQAFDAGFDHHLAKPLNPERLLELLTQRTAAAS